MGQYVLEFSVGDIGLIKWTNYWSWEFPCLSGLWPSRDLI